jgi:DNA-directed RNA polymerase subunit RPC12/RpoP
MTPLACPLCGQPVGIPEQRQMGQRFRCPHCRQQFVLEQQPPKKKSEAGTPPVQRQQTAPLPPGWVPLDLPENQVQSGKSKVQGRTIQDTPDRSSMEKRPLGRPVSDVAPGNVLDTLSPLGTGGAVHGLAARRAGAGKRRRRLISRLLIPGGVITGIALVAIIFGWDYFANRGGPAMPVPSVAASGNAVANAGRSTVQDRQRSSTLNPEPRSLDQNSRPIRLLLAPAGVRMVVHLRPAELWAASAVGAGHPSRGEELRRCLNPLSEWTERQIVERCLFPPSQIDEVLFALVLRSPGDPPDVAATVWLKKATSTSEIAKQFEGRSLERATLPTFVKGDRALVIRDGHTFVVGPKAAAQEMADANEQPNPTDESIEELLKQTDRNRAITFVFRPDDLDRFRESLFPPAFQVVAHGVARWLDPDAAEGAVLSFRLANPFRMRLALRTRPSTTVHHLEEDVQQRLERLPAGILADVARLDPRTSGRRKLVGRVPAMWKAVALGTQSTTQNRLAIFESVLPERAAPNLALGTYLALTEPQSAAPGSKGAHGRQASPQDQSKTVAQRLTTKVDVDFRRMPLSDAFASIGEDIGVTFEIDGGALKIAGYTKNMPQNFRLAGVPATEALRTMLKPYAKMALVIDEPRQTVIVTTREAAEAKGQKPLVMEK